MLHFGVRILLCIFFVLSVTVPQVLSANLPNPHSGVLEFNIELPPYEIIHLPNNETRIVMEDVAFEQMPGYPRLPSLSKTYALPPGCRASHVEVIAQREPIPGSYVIEACEPSIPVSGYQPAMEDLNRLYEQNRARIYSGSYELPDEPGRLFLRSHKRELSLVSVRLLPFYFIPASRVLSVADRMTVYIHYEPAPPSEFQQLICYMNSGRSTGIPTYVDNRDQAQQWYHPDIRGRSNSSILILTLDHLSPYLSDYISWRESTGIEVSIVTRDEILASAIEGIDLQQRIRKWLREYATDYDYLLIIADHTDIPMRTLSPCNEDPWNNALLYPFQSDIYYGDLSLPDSESWDMDGDGIYGEVIQLNEADDGLDAPDFNMELHVGRIKTSSHIRVQRALEKIWKFESNTDHVHKRTPVLGSGILFYYEGGTVLDGGYLSEYMMNEGVYDRSLATTLYEQAGDNPSNYPCTQPLTSQNLISALAGSNAGIFMEFNHGWMDGFAQSIWDDVNNDTIPQNSEIESILLLTNDDCDTFDQTEPFVSFLISCLCGYPETECLAQQLVEHAGPGVVAQTRIAHAIRAIAADRVEPGDGGIDDLVYYDIGDYLLTHGACNHVLGPAVDENRAKYVALNPGVISLCNAYGHALYGDPSLRHFGREGEIPVSVDPIVSTPLEYEIYVDQEKTICLNCPVSGPVKIDLWNLQGHRITTICTQRLSEGEYSFIPRDRFSSGLYVLRLKTPSVSRSIPFVVKR